jgi:hypothetical protein
MAIPPDLVRAVSVATGLPLATATDLDRRLAMAGLRSKGGRGPNAAKVTPLDAARLLTAIVASPQSNTAAEAVLRYSETRSDKARSSPGLFDGLGLDDLTSLSAKHSFVEGLAAVIISAASGFLAKIASGSQGPHIEVFAFTQATHGRIRLSGLPNGLTASVEYVSAEQSRSRKSKAAKAQRSSPRDIGDLEQSRRLTERTIFAVARLFS